MHPTITNWNVDPYTVGPMYPLAGWEMAMFVACAAFCLGFMVWKFVTENAKYDDKARRLNEPDELARALSADPLYDRLPTKSASDDL